MTITENTTAPGVIEGEIVDNTQGPQQGDATEGPQGNAADKPAGEDSSSGGEVVKRDDDAPEVSDLSEKQAKTLTERIKKGLTSAADTHDKLNKQVGDSASLMAEAFQKKIWLALGEASWDDFVAKELGEVRVRLERSVRQSLVYQLNTGPAHMSSRAIAPVLGVDQKTVVNDLRQVKRELNVDTASATVGTDGKVYNAEATSAPRTRKPKPIEDRFNAAIEKADAAVGDLTSLSVEDGWDDAVGAVRKSHKAAIARLIDSLKGVQERLTQQG